VEDAIDAIDGLGDSLLVKQIALDELDPIAKALHIRFEAGAEIIQHADAITAFDQSRCNMRSDEARPAGNENSSHEISLLFNIKSLITLTILSKSEPPGLSRRFALLTIPAEAPG
jgi:hypothetical protein